MAITNRIRHNLVTGVLAASLAVSGLGIGWADDECETCGVVTAVQSTANGTAGVAGGTAGALAAGAAAHAASGGDTLTTALSAVAGAVGGAYAENAMTGSKWTVTVRMDEGGKRTVVLNADPKVKVGDHVKVGRGKLTQYRGEQDD